MTSTETQRIFVETLNDLTSRLKASGFEGVGKCVERSRMAMETREAARSASGECNCTGWREGVDGRCLKCGKPMPRFDPAPATAARETPQPVSEPASGLCQHSELKDTANPKYSQCAKCGDVVLNTAMVPEAAAGDEAGRVKPAATRLRSEAQPPTYRTPQDGASPVPAPPDAAQGKPTDKGLTEDEAANVLHKFRHAHAGTTTGESGLRECPFCSGQMIVREHSAFHPENECFLSGIGAHGTLELDEHDYAVWNTRSTPRAREGDGPLVHHGWETHAYRAIRQRFSIPEGTDIRTFIAEQVERANRAESALTRHSTATQADGGTK